MNDDPKYLPEEFLTRMNNMLGDDFQAFLNSYQQPRTFGLRVNTAKISCEEFEKIVPFPMSVRPNVHSIRPDFIIFRSQVP